MDGKDAYRAAAEAARRERAGAQVRITLEKRPGETAFTRRIEAGSARAALDGLAVLVAEYAGITGLEAVQVLGLLAVCLTGPDG